MDTLNSIFPPQLRLIYERGYYRANIADITQLCRSGCGNVLRLLRQQAEPIPIPAAQFSHRIRKELSIKTSGCPDRRNAERRASGAWLEFIAKNPYIQHYLGIALCGPQALHGYYENFCKSYMRSISSGKEKGRGARYRREVLAYMLMGISNFVGLKYGMFERAA